MTVTQEIAYSENFICPSQQSVDKLREAQNNADTRRLFAQTNLADFTFLSVPSRVVEILDGMGGEVYGKIATRGVTPLLIIGIAQERYEQECVEGKDNR